MKKLLALAVVILGFTAVSFGQSTAKVAAAKASATILGPLSLSNTIPMSFGTIVPSGTAGNVTLTTGGTTSGDNGIAVFALPEASAAASFTAAGEVSRGYAISLPLNGVVTLIGAGDPMKVKDFTCSIVVTAGNLGTAGSEVFTVGATLEVAGNQKAGKYNGEYEVTVNYN